MTPSNWSRTKLWTNCFCMVKSKANPILFRMDRISIPINVTFFVQIFQCHYIFFKVFISSSFLYRVSFGSSIWSSKASIDSKFFSFLASIPITASCFLLWSALFNKCFHLPFCAKEIFDSHKLTRYHMALLKNISKLLIYLHCQLVRFKKALFSSESLLLIKILNGSFFKEFSIDWIKSKNITKICQSAPVWCIFNVIIWKICPTLSKVN